MNEMERRRRSKKKKKTPKMMCSTCRVLTKNIRNMSERSVEPYCDGRRCYLSRTVGGFESELHLVSSLFVLSIRLFDILSIEVINRIQMVCVQNKCLCY